MTLVNEKEKESNIQYNIVSDSNRSHTYLLPMLGSNRSEFNYLYQCFYGDENYPEYDNHIFTLLKHSGDEYYNYYVESIRSHGNYILDYGIDDNFSMFVYQVPEVYQNDYDNFKNGKYSRLSGEYKIHILKFHNKDIHSTVAKVLYRAEELYKSWEDRIGVNIDRNQEIGSLPIYSREVYSNEMRREIND